MKTSKHLFTDSLLSGYILITPREKKRENRKRRRVAPPLENDKCFLYSQSKINYLDTIPFPEPLRPFY